MECGMREEPAEEIQEGVLSVSDIWNLYMDSRELQGAEPWGLCSEMRTKISQFRPAIRLVGIMESDKSRLKMVNYGKSYFQVAKFLAEVCLG